MPAFGLLDQQRGNNRIVADAPTSDQIPRPRRLPVQGVNHHGSGLQLILQLLAVDSFQSLMFFNTILLEVCARDSFRVLHRFRNGIDHGIAVVARKLRLG
jgi:hypothetical protein